MCISLGANAHEAIAKELTPKERREAARYALRARSPGDLLLIVLRMYGSTLQAGSSFALIQEV